MTKFKVGDRVARRDKSRVGVVTHVSSDHVRVDWIDGGFDWLAPEQLILFTVRTIIKEIPNWAHVEKGDQIGTVGAATGKHHHFEAAPKPSVRPSILEDLERAAQLIQDIKTRLGGTP